ncbi:MAG TPA: choice-of-anchor Q domain-containing protein, partial [Chitinophagaceae bacterium]|nr:choice-of-anchor Q domain-containing protein [Chitinophagaceae bacterium]
KDPVLYISNYVQAGGNVFTDDLSAVFTNCIIWAENGTAENEVITSKQGAAAFNVNFTNCLWKVKTTPSNITAANIINNTNPVFDSINVTKNFFNFRLKENSPAIDKGIITGLATDLDGNPRTTGLPDLGAYEKQ